MERAAIASRCEGFPYIGVVTRASIAVLLLTLTYFIFSYGIKDFACFMLQGSLLCREVVDVTKVLESKVLATRLSTAINRRTDLWSSVFDPYMCAGLSCRVVRLPSCRTSALGCVDATTTVDRKQSLIPLTLQLLVFLCELLPTGCLYTSPGGNRGLDAMINLMG